MDNTVKKESYKGLEITVAYDECPVNVYELDLLGEYACYHRKYKLGNVDIPMEDIEKETKKKKYISFPLYMYDHSRISLSLSNKSYPFNDRWDAGQLGFVLVNKDNARKRLGVKNITKKAHKEIYDIISNEINMIEKYTNSEILAYSVEAPDTKETLISCGGFYDDVDEIIKIAKEDIDEMDWKSLQVEKDEKVIST